MWSPALFSAGEYRAAGSEPFGAVPWAGEVSTSSPTRRRNGSGENCLPPFPGASAEEGAHRRGRAAGILRSAPATVVAASRSRIGPARGRAVVADHRS